jgi:alcohol dehydrogenase (NADP+)
MRSIQAFGTQAADQPLEAMTIERRGLRPDDVAIEIDYCGVCHSDLHFARNDWGWSEYPVIPGHEIIGRVTAVGQDVTLFKPGDRVGVGCLVDSCRQCGSCDEGLEQYCEQGWVGTYGGRDRHDGSLTFGGYSEAIMVSERFVLRIPDKLEPASAAPLLCAGITTYSPLKHLGVGQGHKVGVIGMGGLGHMGIKFAHAMGAEVTLLTRSEAKAAEARAQGADHVLVTTDPKQMEAAAGRFDFLLNTVPVPHDFNPYLETLARDGTMIVVGLIDAVEPPVHTAGLILKRRAIIGSLIGGLPETQEMLDFCAEHDITCDVEMIDMQQINQAYERLEKGEVKYRFVIDIESLRPEV